MISADRQLCVIDTSRSFTAVSPLLKYPPTMETSNNRHSRHHRHHNTYANNCDDSLEEKLRRERQRLHSGGSGVTQFNWVLSKKKNKKKLILLIPLKGSLYVQYGINGVMTMVYDKSSSMLGRSNNCRARSSSNNTNATNYNTTSATNNTNPQMTGSVVGRDAAAIDAQLSPDGTMVAFVVAGDIYLVSTAAAETAAETTTTTTSNTQRRCCNNNT
mmetsp:Transcript_27213/g.30109  ORF Transcript_27213/g.30109 Transcript_27213/m.30109 type:complete len:216 (+) Transcript_27213:1468-2115(+)